MMRSRSDDIDLNYSGGFALDCKIWLQNSVKYAAQYSASKDNHN